MRIGIEAQRVFRVKKHGMDIYALQLIRHLQLCDTTNDYFIFVKKDVDVCLKETETTSCPLCQANDYSLIAKEWGTLGIAKCKKCKLIYVNPRLKDPEKIYWGNKEAYIKEAKLIFEGKMSHHRDPNYLEDLEIIRNVKPTGNLLDVGPNIGSFLRLAKNGKWNLFGVEPSPTLSEIAREKFGLNIKNTFLEKR